MLQPNVMFIYFCFCYYQTGLRLPESRINAAFYPQSLHQNLMCIEKQHIIRRRNIVFFAAATPPNPPPLYARLPAVSACCGILSQTPKYAAANHAILQRTIRCFFRHGRRTLCVSFSSRAPIMQKKTRHRRHDLGRFGHCLRRHRHQPLVCAERKLCRLAY